MAADLTRALEMLDTLAPQRPRRSPIADLDASVDAALKPTMTEAPTAAMDRAVSQALDGGGSYADFKAGRGSSGGFDVGGPAGGGAPAAGNAGPGFTMATPGNVASLFGSSAP